MGYKNESIRDAGYFYIPYIDLDGDSPSEENPPEWFFDIPGEEPNEPQDESIWEDV